MTVSLILGEIDAESMVREWSAEAALDDASQFRKEARFPLLTPATITHNRTDTYAMCRDISKKGVGIIQSGAPPNLGHSTLSISLRQQVVYLDVNFTWRKRLGTGWWTCGGEMNFASIDFASLMLLQMSNAVDRRIHHRHPFCQLFVVFPNLELEDDCIGVQNLPVEQGVFAISLDISQGGMRLMCHKSLQTNKKYIYIQTRESARNSSLIRGEIVSRRELGNGYFVVGVKFTTS